VGRERRAPAPRLRGSTSPPAGARAGIQILFGTDVGYLTDYDPTDEVILMATSAFSWREILVSLTTAPAARSGEASRQGRIAVGMDGYLVVLAADPVRDLQAFPRVRHTVRGGRVVYSATAAVP
jgi:imidazolonepropionase-like amidohydrolase